MHDMPRLPGQAANVPAAETGEEVSPSKTLKNKYDPEMLYVECRVCGLPVVWEAGRTTLLLSRSSIHPGALDEHCLILSEGCPSCRPGENGYTLSVVRLANFGPFDFVAKYGGRA